MSRTVLIVEDDSPIRRGIVDALQFAGYVTRECASGKDAVAAAIDPQVSLLLLDVMLPGLDGFSILDQVRARRPNLPIIMVTARGNESDRVRGLRDGADDYVVKPFSAKELLARVEAVLRRAHGSEETISRLRQGSIAVDLLRREIAFAPEERTSLSDKEVAILRHLAMNRDRAVDRDELLESIWGFNPARMRTRTVDMHIARLREKLQQNGDARTMISTVRGKGYMLADDVEVDVA